MDPALELMTNLLMRDGKKSQAQRRMSRMLESIQRATNLPPVPLIHRALSLVSPAVRVTSVVISRRAKDVPKALDERQRIGQAIRWIYRAAERGRKAGVPRETRIAREILSAMAARAQLSTNSGRR
ncbi:hypothetical protein TREMEDRAFT_65196 [Tremella mesenterica DSM 1558]|uniref:uncharacterized protein n=1 Tax=Tremella mesenterica (strain ATCC 24925 / CBS 8224 / DSM 1558 / NBRC 9311 / NRRL Y-6157 / RJB 2259-6 / UBC 559-6) TaxID=578456 RepID=UPI00032D056A|nr:uncharacterized protein TREMEDRAFT_65196 [Tremella mesenterica DSM 1558]EIW66794.1 hypothetical protein TREMEDRAFT_65196 [Tremella mesenterica DSM 1558]